LRPDTSSVPQHVKPPGGYKGELMHRVRSGCRRGNGSNQIAWTWLGSAPDGSNTVTPSDDGPRSPGGLPAVQVGGGHDAAFAYSTTAIGVDEHYRLVVVAHRPGHPDSAEVTDTATAGTAHSTGVKEIDVYNCAAAGARTVWISTGDAFTNAARFQVVGDAGGTVVPVRLGT
jgi:hypothetical protein